MFRALVRRYTRPLSRREIVVPLIGAALLWLWVAPNPFASHPRAAIEYRAAAESPVSVSYATTKGQPLRTTEAATAWSYRRTAKAGDFLYVSAQQGDTPGCVVVRIIRDGQDVAREQNCGPFARASVSIYQ